VFGRLLTVSTLRLCQTLTRAWKIADAQPVAVFLVGYKPHRREPSLAINKRFSELVFQGSNVVSHAATLGPRISDGRLLRAAAFN
jgi:hypothetical protein